MRGRQGEVCGGDGSSDRWEWVVPRPSTRVGSGRVLFQSM